MSRSGPTAYDVALYEELLSEGVVKKLGNVHGPFSATFGWLLENQDEALFILFDSVSTSLRCLNL